MKITAITGQTASGKTGHALRQAVERNGELVNFDARQVYKKLDIITGKDFTSNNFTKVTGMDGYDIGYYTIDYAGSAIRVWLYDMADPKTAVSSYDFARCAQAVLRILKKEGKTAILVGGTYLYLYQLLYGTETEVSPDQKLRDRLQGLPVEALRKELAAIDPDIVQRLNNSDRSNPQRLIRKIEIAARYRTLGQLVPLEMKYVLKDEYRDPPVEITGIAFSDRSAVRDAITLRVRKRLEQGALDEVRKLLEAGYTPHDPGMKTIGYAQLIRHLAGEISFDEAVGLWTTAEVQYTKRQLTFMKKDPHIGWISV